MKNKISGIALIALWSMSLTSCSVIEGIFKAGMGVGIFMVIAVIALIIFVISKLGKK